MTYEFLGLVLALDLDVGLLVLANDLEGEMLRVCLHLEVVELPADETLGIEDGVLRVHRSLVFCGIADETLLRRECDVGGRRTVTLCTKSSEMRPGQLY